MITTSECILISIEGIEFMRIAFDKMRVISRVVLSWLYIYS